MGGPTRASARPKKATSKATPKKAAPKKQYGGSNWPELPPIPDSLLQKVPAARKSPKIKEPENSAFNKYGMPNLPPIPDSLLQKVPAAKRYKKGGAVKKKSAVKKK